MQQTYDRSYGVIPVYTGGSETSVLIVQHAAGHWSLPKGTPEDNETPMETATRELREETGIADAAVYEYPSFNQYYRFRRRGVLHRKTVTYFVGYVEDPAVRIPPEEISDYKWVSFDEGRTMLVVAGNPNHALDRFISWWNGRAEAATTGAEGT